MPHIWRYLWALERTHRRRDNSNLFIETDQAHIIKRSTGDLAYIRCIFQACQESTEKTTRSTNIFNWSKIKMDRWDQDEQYVMIFVLDEISPAAFAIEMWFLKSDITVLYVAACTYSRTYFEFWVGVTRNFDFEFRHTHN